jgi:hypothetical protein
MVDTRTIAHEVQEQLMGAMQRGQEEFRKRQEQLRKGQEQLRKGREAVNVAIRNGNEMAKAVRPNVQRLQGKGLHLPPLETLTSPAKLRAHAQEVAGQFAATQRTRAERAFQVASPLVTEGVARLNKAVSSLLEERDLSHSEPLAPPAAQTAEKPTLVVASSNEPGTAEPAKTKTKTTAARAKAAPAAGKAAPASAKAASGAKPRTPKSKA